MEYIFVRLTIKWKYKLRGWSSNFFLTFFLVLGADRLVDSPISNRGGNLAGEFLPSFYLPVTNYGNLQSLCSPHLSCDYFATLSKVKDG